MLKHLAALIAGFALNVTFSEAAVITVAPTATSVQVGESLEIFLLVSGLGVGGAPSIGVFDLDFIYDPEVLTFQSAVFGDQLDVLGFGSLQLVDYALGTVNIFELSFDLAEDLTALQMDSFVLATLTFSTSSAGVSDLLVAVLSLGDAEGLPINFSVENGLISVRQVQEVPLPAAAWLMIAGLGGLFAAGRKRAGAGA